MNFTAAESVADAGDIDLLRASARAFAAKEIAPRAADIDRENEFPADLWRQVGPGRLAWRHRAGVRWRAGMGYLAHIVAMEEISRASRRWA